MALTHSVLAPLTAAIGRAHGRFGATEYARARSVRTANPYVTYAPLYTGRFAGIRASHHYPPAVASRVAGTAGNAALSRTAAGMDPYVTFAPAFTGRFAGRHYAQPRLGTVQWRGRWAGPRFGQSSTPWYAGIVNAAENLAGGLPVSAPEAGGGWVSTTTNADNSKTIGYVDASGQSAIMTVPANPDGSPPSPDQLTAAVAATGAGTTPPIIPSAVSPWLLGIGGVIGAIVLYKVLK